MRKLIVSMFLLAALNSFSQFNSGKQLSIGIKVSPAIGWIDVLHNDLTADGATMKFGAGIVTDYKLTDVFSFSSGLSYNGLGGYVFDSQSMADETTNVNYKLNYRELELPLLIKIRNSSYNETNFYIQGGAMAGLLMMASELHKSTIPNTELPSQEIMPISNKMRLSFAASFGVEHQVGRFFTLFGDIMFKKGLTNTAKGEAYVENGRYTEAPKIMPGALELSMGIMF